MTARDKMYMKIYNIENADVYLAKGKKYLWFNHLDQMVEDGDIFDTKAGWSFYVTGVSNSIFRGTFTMKIWIEKNKAKSLLKVPESKKKPTFIEKTVVIKEDIDKKEDEKAENGPTATSEDSSPINQNSVDDDKKSIDQKEVTRESDDEDTTNESQEQRGNVNNK